MWDGRQLKEVLGEAQEVAKTGLALQSIKKIKHVV